jgi:O-antigen ligase
VSESSGISEPHAILDGLGRQQATELVRGATFVGTLLLAWVSLHPFPDLSDALLADLTTGNETLTYAAFGCLAGLATILLARDNAPALRTLLSPGYVLFGGWILLSALLSLDPVSSMRRLVLTICVVAVAALLMLLPKSASQLIRWLSIAVLGLLAICYLGLLLAPHLAIHLATDAQEPALAGDWRGSFGHKNVAAAVMAMLLFLGIYIARSGAWISGALTIGLALLFLLHAGGKSSLGLCLAVLALTSLAAVVSSFWLRAVILLAPLALLLLLGVGTVMSDSLAGIAQMLPLDSSFTGRTDIWTFATEAARQRLLTGYGFEAFWGGSSVKGLPEGMEWAATAANSHNGYLDTVLTMGLPGLALLIAVFVIGPLRDFHAADRAGNGGPFGLALLQVWLFGIYLSSLESFYFDRDDPIWFTFLLAVFGLHYLARFRMRE